jgi:hypothetical protein
VWFTEPVLPDILQVRFAGAIQRGEMVLETTMLKKSLSNGDLQWQ